MASAPILQQADPTEPHILRTDAYIYALGVALIQRKYVFERAIEYGSKLLNPAKRNYTPTKREVLEVVWATEYLKESEIIIALVH